MIDRLTILGKHYFPTVVSSIIKSGPGPYDFLVIYGSINAFHTFVIFNEYKHHQYSNNMIYMCYDSIYELSKLCFEGGSIKVSIKFTPQCDLTING